MREYFEENLNFNKSVIFLMKFIVLSFVLCLFISCSQERSQSIELPTKYPDTPTSGSAYEATEELYKK